MKSSNLLRNIPSVSELLERPQIKSLVDRLSHNVVADSVRTFLDDLRDEVKNKATQYNVPPVGELADKIASYILRGERPPMRPVINATGVALHTGLGRAPLAEEAIEEMAAVARNYASVEFDLKTGQRSQRMDVVAPLLCRLTGAEAALVVNNNAGATLLALSALASGREVIVSRGQLVEIGGSYRLPDVMAASGARLREVGTTNKTRASDYAEAIGEETAALMRVHTSNFRVVGFTEEAPLDELVQLAGRHRLPLIDDIGSGALVDFAHFGCPGEPLARGSVAAGADLVLFSGDKLLGGPQCGVAVGRRDLIEQMAKHPLARALRVDKLTLAALSATLRLYRDEKRAELSVPLLQLAGAPLENLRNRAERLAPQIAATSAVESAEAIEETTQLGGGSLPLCEIPTWCIAVRPAGRGLDELSRVLRTGATAVVGRVSQDRLLLDLRSVFPRQDIQLVEAFEGLDPSAPSESDPAASEEAGAGPRQAANEEKH